MNTILNKFSAIFFPVDINEKLDSISFVNKFIALSINKKLSDSVTMSRVIQLENVSGDFSQHVLMTENKETLLKIFENNKLISYSKKEDIKFKQNYVDKVAKLFLFSIDQSKVLLSEPSAITSEASNEAKGLEWIKVSLVVLKSAVEKSIEDAELYFEGLFFYGQRSVDAHTQMRIQCLSLDFLLEFLADGRLRVSAWNYKNLEQNSKEDPTFMAEFVMAKQKVFDEFIDLIVLMSRAATKID